MSGFCPTHGRFELTTAGTCPQCGYRYGCANVIHVGPGQVIYSYPANNAPYVILRGSHE